MFNMKMRARYLIRGRSLKIFIRSMLPSLLLFSALLSAIIPVMSIYYGVKAVIPYLTESFGIMICVLLGLSSLALLLFSFMVRLYNKAELFSLSDPLQCKGSTFFSFTQTVRYIKCRFIIFVLRCTWALVFFSPAFITAGFTAFQLIYSGEMIKSIFITLFALTVLLFIGGAAFYFTVMGRYFLADYLMLISPIQPAKEVVSSSVLSLQGKLLSLAFIRLRLIPLKILSALMFFLPYYRAFLKLLIVMTAEKLYGRRLNENKTAPVVFYISRKSVFSLL